MYCHLKSYSCTSSGTRILPESGNIWQYPSTTASTGITLQMTVESILQNLLRQYFKGLMLAESKMKLLLRCTKTSLNFYKLCPLGLKYNLFKTLEQTFVNFGFFKVKIRTNYVSIISKQGGLGYVYLIGYTYCQLYSKCKPKM